MNSQFSNQHQREDDRNGNGKANEEEEEFCSQEEQREISA
jgi:hypothetical protein